MLILPLCLAYGDESRVEVKVSKESVPQGVRYRYDVLNQSEYPLVALMVGENYMAQEPFQLTMVPLGWDFDKGAPKNNYSAPAGWSMIVRTQEEGDLFSISWRIKEQKYALLPGSHEHEFSVVLSSPNAGYETGYWTAFTNHSVIFTGSYGQSVAKLSPNYRNKFNVHSDAR